MFATSTEESLDRGCNFEALSCEAVADRVRFGAGLRVECGSCGAARTLDGYQAAKLGGAQPLPALARRLKCSRCGSKDARLAILPPL